MSFTFKDWQMAYGGGGPPNRDSTLGFPNASGNPGPMDEVENQRFYVGTNGTRYYVLVAAYNDGTGNHYYLFLSSSLDGKNWVPVSPISGGISIPGSGTALAKLAAVFSPANGWQYMTDWVTWSFDRTNNKFYFVILQDANVSISSKYIFPQDVARTITFPTNEPDYRVQSCIPSVLIYDCTANTLTGGSLTLPTIWLSSCLYVFASAGPCGAQLIFNKARTNYLFFFNSLAFSNFTYFFSGSNRATTGLTSNLVYVSNNGATPISCGFPYSTLGFSFDANLNPQHTQQYNALRFVIQDDDDIAYVFVRTGTWTWLSNPTTSEQDKWYIATYNLNTGAQIDQMQLLDGAGHPYTSQIGFPILYKDASGNKLISLAQPQNIVLTIHVNSDGTLGRTITADSVIIGISVNSTDHCPKFTFDNASKTLYLWGNQRSDGAPPYHRGVWYQSKSVPSGFFGALTDTSLSTDVTDSGLVPGSDTSGNEPFDIEAYNINSNMSIANMGTDYAIGFSTRYFSILPQGSVFWRETIAAPPLTASESFAPVISSERASLFTGTSNPCSKLVDSSLSNSINYQF